MNAVNESLIRDTVSEALGRLGGGVLSQVPRRRMPAALTLFFPNLQHAWPIHLECLKGGSACGGKSDEPCACPAEVGVPSVAPRIKDWNFDAARCVNGRLPRTLSQRTRHAGKSEVVQARRAPGGLGNHMVEVEGSFLRQLGKQAILATIAGAMNDRLPQMLRHRHAVSRLSGSTAPSGAAARTTGHSSPRALQLRDVPPPSGAFQNPACPTTRAAAVRLLPGDGAGRNRPAFQFQSELSVAYSRSYRARPNISSAHILESS